MHPAQMGAEGWLRDCSGAESLCLAVCRRRLTQESAGTLAHLHCQPLACRRLHRVSTICIKTLIGLCVNPHPRLWESTRGCGCALTCHSLYSNAERAGLSTAIPLPAHHRPSTASPQHSTAFPWLPSTFHCLSATFHCLSLAATVYPLPFIACGSLPQARASLEWPPGDHGLFEPSHRVSLEMRVRCAVGHSAAPPSPFSRRLNSDGEGLSAE